MTKPKQVIRILVADDHAIFREGLRKLLEAAEEIQIVGEASNGVECIKMLAKYKPDILLLDLRMPEKDGLGVLEEINFDSMQTRVIVLTAAEDDRDVVRVTQAHGDRNAFGRRRAYHRQRPERGQRAPVLLIAGRYFFACQHGGSEAALQDLDQCLGPWHIHRRQYPLLS